MTSWLSSPSLRALALSTCLTTSLGCGGAPTEDAGVDAGLSSPIDRLRAASEGPSEVHAEGGLVTSVRGRFTTHDTSAEAARDFLVDHGEAFGVSGPDDLAIGEVREDELARTARAALTTGASVSAVAGSSASGASVVASASASQRASRVAACAAASAASAASWPSRAAACAPLRGSRVAACAPVSGSV